jgi:redox-sensitive bicupin YhaK (pirin superfamily)
MTNSSILIHKAADRGHTRLDWLDGWHSFSFGSYQDRNHMHFASLRVLNDDRVKGGNGFDTHAHDNFEIFTYMIEGALRHQDSMGNGAIIRRGDVQLMSAGSGLTHSEHNASATEQAHLLQVWFFPKTRDTSPHYKDARFDEARKKDRLCLMVSPDGRDDSLVINQDVLIYASLLDQGSPPLEYAVTQDRHVWIQIAQGSLVLNGHHLEAGDGVGITSEQNLIFTQAHNAEFLVVDMAAFSK